MVTTRYLEETATTTSTAAIQSRRHGGTTTSSRGATTATPSTVAMAMTVSFRMAYMRRRDVWQWQ